MEFFGETPQPVGNPTNAGFNFVDSGQRFVQIHSNDGFAHRVDEVLRPALQGFGRKLGRFLLGRDSVVFFIRGTLLSVSRCRVHTGPPQRAALARSQCGNQPPRR